MRRLMTLMAVAGLGLTGVARGAELTDELVVGYAESLTEVENLVESYESRGEITWNEERFKPKRGEEWAPMSGVAAEMEGLPIHDDFVAIIQAHGFEGAAQWGEVGDRVMKAMVALQMRAEEPSLDEQMARTLAEIDANPNMTPEQKAMMRQSMQGAFEMLEVMSNAPEADMEAVEPHMPLLVEVMNVED